jgi:hypothetical protein
VERPKDVCEARITLMFSVLLVVQIIGKTAGFAIPVLVVLLVLVGFFAASSYDGGATSVMRP